MFILFGEKLVSIILNLMKTKFKEKKPPRKLVFFLKKFKKKKKKCFYRINKCTNINYSHIHAMPLKKMSLNMCN